MSTKVGQGKLVPVYDQRLAVRIYVQDYKSLCLLGAISDNKQTPGDLLDIISSAELWLS